MAEIVTDEMRAAVNRRAAVNKSITELTKAQAAKRRGPDADPIFGESHELMLEALARVDGDDLRRVLAELSDEFKVKEEAATPPTAPHANAPAALVNPFGQ